MGLRDRLDRAKCAMGRHAGEWVWVGVGSCEQTRTCPRCGKVAAQTAHSLSDWAYATPDDTTSCLMERHCQRCSLSETTTRHHGKWRYLTDDEQRASTLSGLVFTGAGGPCAGRSFCTRCGAPDSVVSTRHEFDAWHPDPLAPTLTMTQPGNPGLAPPPSPPARQIRTCLRCQHQESML